MSRNIPVSHFGDIIMDTMASQITSLTIVYSTVYSGADQRKHQSSASLAFVRVIQRGPVNSPHKWPVTRKMFPFDDVIMSTRWVKHFINRCLFFSYELLKNIIVGMWIHIIFPFSSCIFVVTNYLWIDSNLNIACNEMSHFVLSIAPCKYYARITRHEYDIR